jgi:hypothetical protein
MKDAGVYIRRPTLTFFCELDAEALETLFADDRVIEHLRALNASISMGIRDFDDRRVAVVRRLNEAGVPLVAWLLLPEAQGYWFNLDNAFQAVNYYFDFRTWTEVHALQWARIGLDIEPDIREMARLLDGELGVLPVIARRLVNGQRFYYARALYAVLVDQIRADGYLVDSYHFPFIVDERRVGSSLLQRAAGLVDIPSDREVLMLYSSFMRPWGHAVLWNYAPDAQSVGVGVTGGGVELPDAKQIAPLDWEELARDLRLAQTWSDDVHIFSLEGAVQQGFLERLRDFDWDAQVVPPLDEARRVARLRAWFRAMLWCSKYPGVLTASLLGLLWLLRHLRRKDEETS